MRQKEREEEKGIRKQREEKERNEKKVGNRMNSTNSQNMINDSNRNNDDMEREKAQTTPMKPGIKTEQKEQQRIDNNGIIKTIRNARKP